MYYKTLRGRRGRVQYLASVCLCVCLMVINATFNNISVIGISWSSVLLVEETGESGENHQPVASH
jgi:uncharacterized membrane protein YhaH (DUF805 family)